MKTRFIACCILSFFAFLAPGQAGGAVIYVSPEGSHVPPFDSLQNAATNIHEAVESATDGAEVRIYPGHYVLTNTLTLSNAISLISVDGPENTIIDGNDEVQCIVSSHPDTLVEGLTIQRGRSDWVSPTRPPASGAGILLQAGGTVRRCVVRNCHAASSSGGGVSVRNGGLLDSTLIVSNSATYFGGGVSLSDGTIRNCLIVRNRAEQGGGISSSGWMRSSVRHQGISGCA